MSSLPGGTVTLLFTDIEGSTQLLHELGEDYAAVVGEHCRLLRAAFARNGGVEVDTQGDSFFVAFPRARAALDAALEVQRALASTPVRVRVGIHTGEPAIADERFVGLDVVVGARICAAAHGAQIVVSQTTRDLVDGDLRDLGGHRLKDIPSRIRLAPLQAPARRLRSRGYGSGSRRTRRPCCGYDRLRSALAHITSQFLHQVRVLREYAALQCVALLARHRRDVERVGRLLILRLLQLPAVHQLDVGHGRPRRLPRVLVVEAAAQRSEDLRPVIVERACCAFAVEVARSRGVDAHLIEDESEIDEAWLCGVETVGVTAGASSPESLVSRVLAWFRERGVEQTRTQDTESENVSFRAPVEPRSSSGVA